MLALAANQQKHLGRVDWVGTYTYAGRNSAKARKGLSPNFGRVSHIQGWTSEGSKAICSVVMG